MNIDLINNSDEICNNSVPCMAAWNKLRAKYEKDGYHNTSLTELGGLKGAIPQNTDEGSIYGAEFMPVEHKADYYEYMTNEVVDSTWLAEGAERTFSNTVKEMSEPPVKTYRDLKLTSIPQQQYEDYKPLIYIEGFGYNTTEHYIFKIIMVILILFIILWLARQLN